MTRICFDDLFLYLQVFILHVCTSLIEKGNSFTVLYMIIKGK